MQLRKFYGRTMGGALAQVKRELGPDALILETNTVEPSSAAARTNPGARYEVLAARDSYATDPAAAAPANASRPSLRLGPAEPQRRPTPAPALRPPRGSGLLEDLGILRAQIRDLLEDAPAADATAGRQHPGLDLGDYHALIEQGVDHRALAPHFRRWLEWRTAPLPIRRYLAQTHGGPSAQMEGESLREWLWLAWSDGQGLLDLTPARPLPPGQPRLTALIGPTGGGKTTTMAKLSSIICQQKRQNAVVITLDTHRFGATEQWRRYSKLMGIPVEEIVSQTDLSTSMEHWGSLDWIGIDTPGGMTPDSEAGRLYGSILAHCPFVETVLVLPATQQATLSREQMRRGRAIGAGKVLFSKLDEVCRRGEILNLTLDGAWKIDSFTTGPRVPHDWEPASRETLWQRVLAPQGAGPGSSRSGGM